MQFVLRSLNETEIESKERLFCTKEKLKLTGLSFVSGAKCNFKFHQIHDKRYICLLIIFFGNNSSFILASVKDIGVCNSLLNMNQNHDPTGGHIHCLNNI
jgi:hypothetical protein